jgi:hypothetical protein
MHTFTSTKKGTNAYEPKKMHTFTCLFCVSSTFLVTDFTTGAWSSQSSVRPSRCQSYYFTQQLHYNAEKKKNFRQTTKRGEVRKMKDTLLASTQMRRVSDGSVYNFTVFRDLTPVWFGT